MLTFHLWELEEFSLEARESPLLVGNQRDEHNVLGGQEGQVVRRSIVPTEPTKEGTESVRQLHSEPQVAQISSEQGQELHHQDFRAAQDQPVSSHKDSVPHTEPTQSQHEPLSPPYGEGTPNPGDTHLTKAWGSTGLRELYTLM